jgi:integrase
LSYAKQLWQYALSQGHVSENIASAMRAREFGGVERSRSRVLSTDELQRLIQWLRAEETTQVKLALGLLLLTGQRASEVLQFSPKQVQGRWWTIPATVTKQKRPQRVYLSPQAWAVVKVTRQMYPEALFACRLTSLAQATRRWSTDALDEPLRPHDLRRTMSTHLAELGAAPHVVEHMLGHRLTGVLATYNRSTYDADRRVAWRMWGRYLGGL